MEPRTEPAYFVEEKNDFKKRRWRGAKTGRENTSLKRIEI